MIEHKRMIKKGFVFLFCLLVFSSCTFLSKKVESVLVSSPSLETKPEKISKKNLYCLENNNLQILLEDESTLKYYRPLIPKLFETKNFNFVEKAAIFSLVEMSRRPDQASPSARLQYFLRFNNKDYYFDFSPKSLDNNKHMSFIKGIEVLLRTFNKSQNLSKLVNFLDQTLPQNMNISPELETFLHNNKNDLLKNESLAESFFKGDEALTKHETFKRVQLKKLISYYYSEKISNDLNYSFTTNPLFKIETEQSDLNLKCNTDINKDNSIKEDLVFSDQKKSHYFSLKEGNNIFLAVSSTNLAKSFQNYNSTYFMQLDPSPLPVPLCQFTNSFQDIVLISSSGRNPTQHLKHLVSYDINMVDSFRSLDELLKFSRHLFLSNPDRILYESKRGRKSQIDFFLSMNFPIYHVDSIGDIVGMGSFKNGHIEEKSLLADDRSKARLWCGP